MMQLSFPSMDPEQTIEARVWSAGDCFNAAYGWYLGRGDTPELAVKDLIKRIEAELEYRG